jgi:hypothetical protein
MHQPLLPIVGTVTRAGARRFVGYDDRTDRYVVFINPVLRVLWAPSTWARALASGAASPIGPTVAA